VPAVKDRLITPSKITAWLDCEHFLTLTDRVDGGLLVHAGGGRGSLAQLLADKGLQHESDCLAAYRREGKSILEIPARDRHESFAAWVARVGDPVDQSFDVIYQMPLVHEGVRGIADFLIRVEDPATGRFGYEPVDAKLARTEAKPGHVLQLCFYADALESMTGIAPQQMHLWLGSGRIESLATDDFRPYWHRIRAQLAVVLKEGSSGAATVPEPCSHCAYCEFADRCDDEWRSQDSLIYVAGIRSQDRTSLDGAGISTVAQLATCAGPVTDVRPDRLHRLVSQATLQVEARKSPDEPPPYRIIEAADDPTWGRGFTFMPECDDGDVFLDFEGHPFWRPDAGLFFLFGLLRRERTGEWRYYAYWAHDLAEEAAATHSLIEFFVERRSTHPGMHVYHYNHTERSALERLATDHGVGEVALANLVETGLFVDLLVVARNAMQVGTESYGLKYLERLTTFERGHEIDQGAGAVVEYEAFTLTHDPAALDRIAAYNEDDVRATRALRDWLVEHRPAGIQWRASWFEPDDGLPELDEHVAQLHAFEPGTPQHLLGDVLGYWRREWLAHLAPKLVQSRGDTPTLLDDPEALAGLTPLGLIERSAKNGRALIPAMRFRLPDQSADAFSTSGDQVIYSDAEGPPGYSSVVRLDLDDHEVDLVWNERSQELGGVPSVVVLNDWVSPIPKPAALADLATRMLDPPNGLPNEVSVALLGRDLPAFVTGHGPPAGRFGDDLEEMTEWVLHLDHSCVAIQGPPGTGKTYRGSHLIRSLIDEGRRVGITAMSHHAIDNLLEETVGLFEDKGDSHRLHAIKRGPTPASGGLAGVTYAASNAPCARAGHNLVAGTTWLFAGGDMQAAPVDVLIVDEAGQLALADALAASRSATSIVLLGDPLQLPQVSQASHPGGGGLSVLEHLLGDNITLPAERGVFLSQTRRMHPDVCSFISEQIYEGRLSSHPSCAGQTTEFGTGLRWLPARHDARSTEAPEEAELVADEISRLLDTSWTNHRGIRSPIITTDIMVVAPYNDQVKLIRARLDRDDRTRGVPVGTVDKFQGRQAAVVFFTMTTSSAHDMTRGAQFLFSRNRLNVAVSRARCLAYLVCTEDLLNSRARTVPEMRLLSTLCSFVEHCKGTTSG
jgi:predicted RecB family nuclease